MKENYVSELEKVAAELAGELDEIIENLGWLKHSIKWNEIFDRCSETIAEYHRIEKEQRND